MTLEKLIEKYEGLEAFRILLESIEEIGEEKITTLETAIYKIELYVNSPAYNSKGIDADIVDREILEYLGHEVSFEEDNIYVRFALPITIHSHIKPLIEKRLDRMFLFENGKYHEGHYKFKNDKGVYRLSIKYLDSEDAEVIKAYKSCKQSNKFKFYNYMRALETLTKNIGIDVEEEVCQLFELNRNFGEKELYEALMTGLNMSKESVDKYIKNVILPTRGKFEVKNYELNNSSEILLSSASIVFSYDCDQIHVVLEECENTYVTDKLLWLVGDEFSEYIKKNQSDLYFILLWNIYEKNCDYSYQTHDLKLLASGDNIEIKKMNILYKKIVLNTLTSRTCIKNIKYENIDTMYVMV